MKRKFFLPVFVSAIFLLQFSVATAQIIPNAGFENWAIAWGYYNPTGWATSNGSTPGITVVQTAGRTGAYSVELTTVVDNIGSPYGGFVRLIYNTPIKPIAISGYWSGYFPSSNQGIGLQISVKDATNSNIAHAIHHAPSPASFSWTYFSFPIEYTSSNAPSYTDIMFTLSTKGLGTHGELDDLFMTYETPTGEIQTIPLLGSYISSDQTGNHSLNLNLTSPSSFTTTIFSVDGKNVFNQNYSLSDGGHNIFLPTQNLPQGIYFCRVQGESVNKAFKFIKQ